MAAKLPTIKSLVRLSLLERVSPELLVRFLRPFEDYLTARQVTLDGAKHDHAWVGALHEVLITVDPEMPGDLQQALLDVTEFWLDRGVDGFRLDTINFYVCDKELRDNPPLAPEARN